MTVHKAVARFRQRIGQAAYQALLTRLRQVNDDIVRCGIVDFEGRKLLTGYSYGEFYDWDLYFENIYLSYYGIDVYCRTNLEVFVDRQLSNGFISRTLVKPRPHQHFKPFMAQLVWLYLRQTNDPAWPDEPMLEKLEKYLDYWLWYCDLDKNGLSVWDSADHSGMDNQMPRADAYGSWTVEGTDLNIYLVRELQAMAKLVERRGLADKARRFRDASRAIRQAVDDLLWDERDGFYYDRNERTGKPIRIKTIAGLLPLWLDHLDAGRAKRLVEEHLLNPDAFWLKYPVASWAKDEPGYDQDATDWGCNWRGTTWIPTNYVLMHGLMRHGYEDTARELAYRTFDLALARNRTTREYYNAETGEGKGLDPFWGWSALAYFMPLECELAYDPTALDDQAMIRLAGELGVRFPDVPD
jgi:hypothetical protein